MSNHGRPCKLPVRRSRTGRRPRDSASDGQGRPGLAASHQDHDPRAAAYPPLAAALGAGPFTGQSPGREVPLLKAGRRPRPRSLATTDRYRQSKITNGPSGCRRRFVVL
jgi:hypothetical protein